MADSPTKTEERLIKDAIHGSIEMNSVLAAIIDTPQFQRLRNIKQLGASYWVYPSASHNRFEHSIGTSYLCGQFISILTEKKPYWIIDEKEKEELITEKDILCIKIAGLCHDMGHGPFSHVFDTQYQKLVAPEGTWKHEKQSCKMFDHMIEKNETVRKMFEEKGIKKEEENLIKDLIMGVDPLDCKVGDGRPSIRETNGKKHCFLYEIVSNARNGIDCDKFDYLMRDSYHIGWKFNFDCMRYFKTANIVEYESNYHIGVRDKEQFALYQLFQMRYALHHQVYQHKTTKAIEAMICDALFCVNEKMKIFESIKDPAAYTYLTDGIIDEICRHNDDSEDIMKAKGIIQNIKARKLYKLCGETIIPCSSESRKGSETSSEERDREKQKKPKDQKESETSSEERDREKQKDKKESETSSEERDREKQKDQKESETSSEERDREKPKTPEDQKKSEMSSEERDRELKKLIIGGGVSEEDFLIQEVSITFGKGSKDPISSVIFFDKESKKVDINKEHISNILPKNFQDLKVRVYCKPNDDKKRKKLEDVYTHIHISMNSVKMVIPQLPTRVRLPKTESSLVSNSQLKKFD